MRTMDYQGATDSTEGLSRRLAVVSSSWCGMITRNVREGSLALLLVYPRIPLRHIEVLLYPS